MQCQPMRCPTISFKTDIKMEKEVIHSGHFMVSDFEAEAQDDEYEVAVPVPEAKGITGLAPSIHGLQIFSVSQPLTLAKKTPPGQLAIETNLTKLFQCMSLAYRQKLTSPKWNRFKGIRLRWKDKIRLNNVIWRCWHMQFIKKQSTLICQFASPLDEGIHNKPEAVVLEGKYWKRKLAAVTAEYKKWRMFYRNKIMGWTGKEMSIMDTEMIDWTCPSGENSGGGGGSQMMVDEDYLELMSDTFFTTIQCNQPFAFPNTREIARGVGLADFIQPSLVQLQPDLDDFMDDDAFGQLQEFFPSKLPPVPEDCAVTDVTYRHLELERSNSEQASSSAPLPAAHYPYQENTPMKTARFYPKEAESVDQTKFTYTEEGDGNPMFLPKTDFTYSAKNANVAKDLSDNFVFESDVSSRSGISFSQVTPSSTPRTYKQQTNTSGQPVFGLQYQKIAPAPTASHQFSRVHQSYDLATCISAVPNPQPLTRGVERSSSLPSVDKEDVFAVPKHISLKSKHRSRSGSSLLTGKSRTHPPPLLSSNSDPNLQKSALLAQLLTTVGPTMFNVKSGNVPILPMPSNRVPLSTGNTTLLITGVPTTQGYITTSRHPGSPEPTPEARGQLVSSPGLSGPQSPASPLMYSSPVSPKKQDGAERSKTPQNNDHRRACHINAEQKRRYNIRNGFEVLHSLIPHLQQSPNVKLSKAAMLQKGAEYIRQLQSERHQAKEEMEGLRHQIDTLNSAINNCQALLPATGAPVSRHRTTKMKEMFDEWVCARTHEDWKFWIFSVLFEPLLTSFNSSVSTASYEDLYRSSLMWVEQHCSLVDLRPAIINSLRHLSTSTDILTEPQRLPDEARAAVSRKNQQRPSS